MTQEHPDPRSGTQTPLVSVVIPTHNRADVVLRAVHSALVQTLADIEVIVVDDGSSDGTRAKLENLNHPRVRYLRHEQARGAPAARNTGTRAARGQWVAFLDDDDIWFPHKLERQIAAASSAVAVISSYRHRGSKRTRIIDRHAISVRDLRKGSPCGCSGITVRRSVALDHPYDETLRKSQDWDLLMRLLDAGTVACVAEPLYEIDTSPRPRITTGHKGRSVDELERIAAATHKHRHRLGSHWFRYRMVSHTAGYLSEDPARWQRLREVTRRYGARAVLHYMLDRVLWTLG